MVHVVVLYHFEKGGKGCFVALLRKAYKYSFVSQTLQSIYINIRIIS